MSRFSAGRGGFGSLQGQIDHLSCGGVELPQRAGGRTLITLAAVNILKSAQQKVRQAQREHVDEDVIRKVDDEVIKENMTKSSSKVHDLVK